MFNILTLNKISANGTAYLTEDKFFVSAELPSPDGILLRSADMHDFFVPETLMAVGRAGAGVNNIPVDKFAKLGIVVFNTPGANANAVKEIVLAGLLLSSRKIVDGINWAQTLSGQTGVAKLIEAGKSKFAGPEISGKKLGVVGLGAIGVLVANAAHSLGMEVYGHDPFLSVDAAWRLSRGVHKAASIDAILAECDYITVHIPLRPETKNLINADRLSRVKQGARILNFSRGELADSSAIKDALANGQISAYVTDFPNEELLNVDGVIPIPHLGASTPESEDNCAVMASKQLRDYLLYGAIKNSVNFPDCDALYIGKKRFCVLHKNVPHVVANLTGLLADRGLNIDYMFNKSKGAYAYTVIDIDENNVNGIDDEFMKQDAIIRVRVI
ncbi:MAG: 3-phosphoglycerate dehydrogenase [Clostridiales bacterium]|jgi:D-3-phosphoglycerate dehydrogenase|nr:3-phosphoglycerate dehydrogenase [Clostridiales bacterium]